MNCADDQFMGSYHRDSGVEECVSLWRAQPERLESLRMPCEFTHRCSGLIS